MPHFAFSVFVTALLLSGCTSSRCPHVSCPRGFECVDGECVVAPDPCESIDCNPNATCRSDLLGSAACECNEGFVVAEAPCQFVDTCSPEEVFCVECLSHNDCCDDECSFPYCHAETNTCVRCLEDAHCWAGDVCRPDVILGAGRCYSSCGSDSDCSMMEACIEGACRFSYCSPSGRVDAASFQQAEYGSECAIFGEGGEELYQGFCAGPVELVEGRVLGVCWRTGDRPDGERCEPWPDHGTDDELCAGFCFSSDHDEQFGVCYPPCHPGDCEEGYCHPIEWFGLLGVCVPDWDGGPKPIGSPCSATSMVEVYRACGEGRLCVDSVCQAACDLAGVVDCPAGGGDCGPLEDQWNYNAMIGWCR